MPPFTVDVHPLVYLGLLDLDVGTIYECKDVLLAVLSGEIAGQPLQCFFGGGPPYEHVGVRDQEVHEFGYTPVDG